MRTLQRQVEDIQSSTTQQFNQLPQLFGSVLEHVLQNVQTNYSNPHSRRSSHEQSYIPQLAQTWPQTPLQARPGNELTEVHSGNSTLTHQEGTYFNRYYKRNMSHIDTLSLATHEFKSSTFHLSPHKQDPLTQSIQPHPNPQHDHSDTPLPT